MCSACSMYCWGYCALLPSSCLFGVVQSNIGHLDKIGFLFLLWRTYLDFCFQRKVSLTHFDLLSVQALHFPPANALVISTQTKKKQRRHWEERKSQNPRHKCVSQAIQECLRFLSFTKSQMDLSNWLHYLSGPAWSQNYLSAKNHSTVEILPPQN